MQKYCHFFCFCTYLTSFCTILWNKICTFAPRFEYKSIVKLKFKTKNFYHEKNLGVHHYPFFLFEC